MRHLRQLFIIVSILFLTLSGNTLIATPDTSESLKPGTATGRLKVNDQAFFIKHAYVRKSIGEKKDKDNSAYIILLTNRPFPEDFSKIDRFEINRYTERYDLQGLIIGINENRELVFADILRVRSIIGGVDFKPLSNEEGLIEGRLYTDRQQKHFGLKYEIDVTFSAEL